ncbi:hypothetical protein B9Q05_03120 [Candidatus Marsarchaeota G2 archaeon ECH_B_1]|jgi:hypothetical protein|nr:MAG: hypothetical protein B9Q05_03120 [Candidatus Marsarchaeota G2 archaeon ECH_B_1]
MVSERVIGGLIFAVFLIILVVFTAVIWYPPLAAAYSILALKIVDWVLVVGVSAIAIWLGWVMISTKPIVPEDKPEQPPTTTTSEGDTATGGVSSQPTTANQTQDKKE